MFSADSSSAEHSDVDRKRKKKEKKKKKHKKHKKLKKQHKHRETFSEEESEDEPIDTKLIATENEVRIPTC